MAPDYIVDVQPFGRDLQVVWTIDGEKQPPYYVKPLKIDRLAGRIRKALKSVVVLSTRRVPSNWTRSPAAVASLAELTEHGYRLYRALFTDARRKAQSTADEIRAALLARRDRPLICFKVDSDVHAPWALMSDKQLPEAPNDGTMGAYRSFWALKYSVATVYDALLSEEDVVDLNYKAIDFHTLIGVDTGIHAQAAAQLSSDSPEASVFSLLQERYGAPVTDSSSLLEAWNTRHERLGLLYLYCHSNDERIGFAPEDDRLDTIAFEQDYEKGQEPPRCLVFLNGCHTAVGEFLEATGRDGFCGFIGAETVVPYLFAHRFGAAVMSLLYSGHTLISIMDRLREQHWPLSLVYGLYAYPALRLDPSFTMPVPSMDNYSEMAVGNQML
jgi:hypothetical protein